MCDISILFKSNIDINYLKFGLTSYTYFCNPSNYDNCLNILSCFSSTYSNYFQSLDLFCNQLVTWFQWNFGKR